VARLCRALEGIPLALELAAARAPVLTPAQMLQHLSDRFGFLVSPRRAAPERHQSLHAALEWSYQTLPEPQQRLLARLSVFRGGWTLEAAAAVDGDFGFRISDFGLPPKADEPGAPAPMTLSDPIQNPKSKIQNRAFSFSV
jgi:predicted ATPase